MVVDGVPRDVLVSWAQLADGHPTARLLLGLRPRPPLGALEVLVRLQHVLPGLSVARQFSVHSLPGIVPAPGWEGTLPLDLDSPTEVLHSSLAGDGEGDSSPHTV